MQKGIGLPSQIGHHRSVRIRHAAVVDHLSMARDLQLTERCGMSWSSASATDTEVPLTRASARCAPRGFAECAPSPFGMPGSNGELHASRAILASVSLHWRGSQFWFASQARAGVVRITACGLCLQRVSARAPLTLHSQRLPAGTGRVANGPGDRPCAGPGTAGNPRDRSQRGSGSPPDRRRAGRSSSAGMSAVSDRRDAAPAPPNPSATR